MTDLSQAVDSTAQALDSEVKLLAELMSFCRVTVLYAQPGTQRESLLRSSVGPLLQAARSSGQTKLVILFDAWDNAPLPALYSHIRAALAQTISTPKSADSGQTLAAALRSWQETYDVTFLFVFDRFDDYLSAPRDDPGASAFEQEFVQAVNDPTLRANFLLVLSPAAEPLLGRLRERIPRLGNDSVRLLSPDSPTERPLGSPEINSPYGSASIAAQNVENDLSTLPDPAPTPPPDDVSEAASTHRRKGVPAFAIALLLCASAIGIFWFGGRAPELSSVGSEAQQRLTAPQRAEINPSHAPIPAKAAEPEQGTHADAVVQRAESPAPQASPARKPSAPPVAAPVEELKPRPSKPQAKAEGSRNSPPMRNPSVDQVYESRAAKECEQGLAGVICRQKIRYQVCAGKWTKEEIPGMTRCSVHTQ